MILKSLLKTSIRARALRTISSDTVIRHVESKCAKVPWKTPLYWPRRGFQTSSTHHHGDESLADLPETISVTFVTKDGEALTVQAKEGERALYLAHRKGIDMEGACEASLACTTCHCYVEAQDPDGQDFFDILPEATETEEDLLDMAPFLQVNSRLGCQIILKPELDGIRLQLPRATKNFYVDGHKPTPH